MTEIRLAVSFTSRAAEHRPFGGWNESRDQQSLHLRGGVVLD
jgi:hypothetical protein